MFLYLTEERRAADAVLTEVLALTDGRLGEVTTRGWGRISFP
jgi:hypothetical protein